VVVLEPELLGQTNSLALPVLEQLCGFHNAPPISLYTQYILYGDRLQEVS
jgi:hypothetical protein